jgi:hypothetical protein
MTGRDTDNLGPEGSAETGEGVWPYLGVGCLTAVAGLVGGGMIAVLISKTVGGIVGCHAEAETGAPCDWSNYWTWGARIGVILLPTVVIWRMRRARAASRNSK